MDDITAAEFERSFSTAEENVRLRYRVNELSVQLALIRSTQAEVIEIEHGRMIINHVDVAGGNPPEFETRKIPGPSDKNSRRT